MTAESSGRIQNCWENGALMDVSLMPNGKQLTEVAWKAAQNVGVCIHVNLVEGTPVSPLSSIPLLVNEQGTFAHSFQGIFFASLGSKRHVFAEQVHTEILAQIETCMAALPKGTRVGIDSHQHTHMIPLVFDQMVRSLDELGIEPVYVRFAAEPLSPGLLTAKGRQALVPINIVKAVLLKVLGSMRKPEMRRRGWPCTVFFGVLYSGRMSYELINALLPRYKACAKRRGTGVEVLFHPGGIEPGEPFLDPYKTSFQEFYMAEGRHIEYDALMRLKAEKDL